MNSTLNIVKIILLSIIAVALILILVLFLNNKININGFTLYEKTEVVYENEFKEEINNLKISTTSNDVVIEEKDIDEVKVKIYDRKDAKPEVSVENDTLVINNKSKVRISFSFGINESSKIVITVPKNSTYNLDIDGTSSDVASFINLKDVKIVTRSGDIKLKDSNNTTIKTTSGDIKLNKVNNSVNAIATSGDMSISEVNGKLSLKTTSGDILVKKLNLISNSSIEVTSGDIVIGKTNELYFDAKVTSGDIKINNNSRKADVELKIKTTSGDIYVNN